MLSTTARCPTMRRLICLAISSRETASWARSSRSRAEVVVTSAGREEGNGSLTATGKIAFGREVAGGGWQVAGLRAMREEGRPRGPEKKEAANQRRLASETTCLLPPATRHLLTNREFHPALDREVLARERRDRDV